MEDGSDDGSEEGSDKGSDDGTFDLNVVDSSGSVTVTEVTVMPPCKPRLRVRNRNRVKPPTPEIGFSSKASLMQPRTDPFALLIISWRAWLASTIREVATPAHASSGWQSADIEISKSKSTPPDPSFSRVLPDTPDLEPEPDKIGT